MSYADYIWNVARSLRADVRPEVTGEAARESLQNCVRVLTAIANALEPKGVTPPPAAPALAPGLAGPPENPALYQETDHYISEACGRIAAGEIGPAALREMVSWEHGLIEAAVNRMDAAEAAEGLAEPDPRLRIDQARLQEYLRRAADEPALMVGAMSNAIGGRSRQTVLFSVSGAPSLPARLVIQRGLPGMAKGDAFGGVAVEHAVMKTMHAAGMKVPRPLFLETGDEALGGPFVIVERLPGRVVEADYWRARAPRRIILDLAMQMALLHRQPIGGLAGVLPRARQERGHAAWAAELDRFTQEWVRKSHGPAMAMTAALHWLRANLDCVTDREALVHNDMVFHNVLAEGDEITAILDWEQAAIGHPAEDLGYCYPVVSELLPWEDFMAAYAAAGGGQISRREVDFFALRALVRLTVLVQDGRAAFEAGCTNDIVVTGAGAFFIQRLMLRLSRVVNDVLTRSV
jgi:aminoglycoside phosphotransferase (APT) family kinase protein